MTLPEAPLKWTKKTPGSRLIPQAAGDADEIATDGAFSVMTLRMGGVVAQHDQRSLAVPETDHPNERVNDALGGGAGIGVASCAPADVANLAVRAQDAAGGSHFFDLGFSNAHVCDHLWPGKAPI